MALPLDTTPEVGDLDHIEHHQDIHKTINGLATANDTEIVTWDNTADTLKGISRTALAADPAFSNKFVEIGDTSTATFAFVIDEDDLESDLATKVPTQRSVRQYVDAAVTAGVTDGDKGDITVTDGVWTIDNGAVNAAKVAADVATQAELDAHTGASSGAHAASAVSYAGSTNLSSTDVEAALDELDTEKVGAAATSTATFGFVVDEDAMTSNSATKVPTQQSVKAYVDSSVAAGVADDSVTNAKLANIATARIKGRVTASTGDPEDLTAAQVKTMLAIANTDVSGLGTMSTQAASAVAITGGSVTGITDIAVADGGTGASSASAARTNLGLVIGTDVQAQNANLGSVAGLTAAANKGVQTTGANTFALFDLTTAGKALIDDADATAQRTTLGLGTAAVAASTDFLPSLPTTNPQTGTTYTLVLGDKDQIVEVANASAITLTVPPNASVAFPVSTQITVLQTGAGQITVAAGAGVTVNATPGLKLRAQWSAGTLVKRATNTWVLLGDLSS